MALQRCLARLLFWRDAPLATPEEELEGLQLLVRPVQPVISNRIPKTHANDLFRVRTWTNSIRTSQYRWWNFLPLNLFQQIMIPSNIYFIVMAVLQMIPSISDSGGVPTFLLPLSFVMAVTMLKDAYEDIQRHRSDSIENTSTCETLLPQGVVQSVQWRDLMPGDIVRVKAGDYFPADMVMLSCSDPYGIAYVETMQLDGETNLKDKTCVPALQAVFVSDVRLENFKLEFGYGPPSARIYSFNGLLRLCLAPPPRPPMTPASSGRLFFSKEVSGGLSRLSRGNSVAMEREYLSLPFFDYPVNLNQFLWRGAKLTNTDWAIGVVAYTGHQTRIFKNGRPRALKYSRLLTCYNRHAIILALSQFCLCLVAAIFFAVNSKTVAQSWYLLPGDGDISSGGSGLAEFISALGIGFGRYVLLLSYFVPITLFVQLEMVKWCQAWFMSHDKQMESAITQKGAAVQTVSLMEELGSITHVFSDKTGTLTLNLMQLKAIAVGPQAYGFGGFPEDPLLAEQLPSLSFAKESRQSEVSPRKKGEYSPIGQFKAPPLLDDESRQRLQVMRVSPNQYVCFDSWSFSVAVSSESKEQRKRLRYFLLIMSLCHSVLRRGATTWRTLHPETQATDVSGDDFGPTSPKARTPKSPCEEDVAEVLASSDAGLEGGSTPDAWSPMIRTPNKDQAELRPDEAAERLDVAAREVFPFSIPPNGVQFDARTSSGVAAMPSGELPRRPSSRLEATRVRRDSDDNDDGTSPGPQWRAEPHVSSSLEVTSPQRDAHEDLPKVAAASVKCDAPSQRAFESPVISTSGMNPAPLLPKPHARRRSSNGASRSSPRNYGNVENSTGDFQRPGRRSQPQSVLNFSPSWPKNTESRDRAYSPNTLGESYYLSRGSNDPQAKASPGRQGRAAAVSFAAPDECSRASSELQPDARVQHAWRRIPLHNVEETSTNRSQRPRRARMSSGRGGAAPLAAGPAENLSSRRPQSASPGYDTEMSPAPRRSPNVFQPAPLTQQPPPAYGESETDTDQPLTFESSGRVRLVEWSKASEVSYDASSPDELALICGAAHLGVEFLRRPNLNSIEVALTNAMTRSIFLTYEELQDVKRQMKASRITTLADYYPSYDVDFDWATVAQQSDPVPFVSGRDSTDDGVSNSGAKLPDCAGFVPGLVVDLLEVLEFDNFRKKMSVVIRGTSNQLILLCKGADSSMLNAAAPQSNASYLGILKEHLLELSNAGLRTLVFGFKFLTEESLQEFRSRTQAAKASGCDDKVTAAYDWLEQDLELVGCTGIDDKLQPEVPQTIEALKSAGVKLWILTGDKLETAVSIGHSCSVLTESTYNAIVNGKSEAEVREQLHQYMTFIVAGQLAKEAFEHVLLPNAQSCSKLSDQGGAQTDHEDDEENEEGFEGDQATTDSLAHPLRGQAIRRGRKGSCFPGAVGVCGPCGGGRCRSRKDRAGTQGRRLGRPKAPLTMGLDDFLRVITFQARHRSVVSQPQQSTPTQLTPQQVEVVIEEYLRSFDPASTADSAIPWSRATQAAEPKNRSNVTAGRSKKRASNAAASPGNDVPGPATTVPDVSSDSNAADALPKEFQVVRQMHAAAPDDWDASGRRKLSYRSVPSLRRLGEREIVAAVDTSDPVAGGSAPLRTSSAGFELAANLDYNADGDGPPLRHSYSSWIQTVEGSAAPSFRKTPTHGAEQRPLHDASSARKSPSGAPATLSPLASAFSTLSAERLVERYTSVAITCTGEALALVLANDNIKRYFFGLANLCATVIACRVTPKQKAEIVQESSRYLSGTVSLSIGDGTNDVGMIVTANVGVGIAGKEGMQAVRSADYAISEFRFLRNLMFHHGHENLRRNSIQVYHTVYKNVLFGMCDWVFGFFSAFSAVDLYNSWLKQIYNLFFTSFPPILYSIFDRILPSDIFISCPWLYPVAFRPDGRMYFGQIRFLVWFVYGMISAVVVTIVPLMLLGRSALDRSGIIKVSPVPFGQAIFWLVVLIATLVLIPFVHTWFWFLITGFAVCYMFWFATWAACAAGWNMCSELEHSLELLDHNLVFHATTVLTVCVGLFMIFTWWFHKILIDPSAQMIIRERIAMGVFDVVVAPQPLGGLTVVVPRPAEHDQWRGFAFSESMSRLQLHRRLSVLPRTVLLQANAFTAAAGDIFYSAAAPPTPGVPGSKVTDPYGAPLLLPVISTAQGRTPLHLPQEADGRPNGSET